MLEQEILYSMIAYPQDISAFLAKCEPKCFSKEGNTLLQAILALHEKQTLSLNTLDLSLSAEFKEGEYYLNFLSANINPHFLNLAPLLTQNYLIEAQRNIASKLLNASASNQIIDLSVFSKDLDIVKEPFKTLDEWLLYYSQKPKLPKLKTGISFLDSCFDGGLELGQLMLISGDPEAGKTMLGIQILENIARAQKVCFFCFEFTIEQYLKIAAQKRLNKQNIYIINDGYDINEVALNIKQLYKQGVRAFLIDSQMRLVSPAGRNMEEEESLKFSILARLCHSLGIIVILIVQTSKGDRDNPMGSKKGGHESSITLRIERNAPAKDDVLQKGNEFDENTRTILVKKNKQTGKHFKELVRFDTTNLTFSAITDNIENVVSREELDAIMSQF